MGKLQSGGTSTLVLCKNREFDLYVGGDTRGGKRSEKGDSMKNCQEKNIEK